MSLPKLSAAKWAILVTGVLLCAAALRTYFVLDRNGLIPHQRDTEIAGYETWPVGQERNCVTLPAQDGAIIFLGCVSSGDFNATQIAPVKYWGRVKRPDRFLALTVDPRMETWKWRCKKKRSSVTCRAVN